MNKNNKMNKKNTKNLKNTEDDSTTLNSDSHSISISNLSKNLTINEELKKTLLDIIEKIKKSKYGIDFSYVIHEKLQDDLKNAYQKIIKKPMDLITLESLIKNGKIITIGEFFNNLFLIFENSKKFNIEKSEIHKRTLFTEKLAKCVLNNTHYDPENNINNVEYYIQWELKNEEEKKFYDDFRIKIKSLEKNSFEFFHEYLSIHFPEIIKYKLIKGKSEVEYFLNELSSEDKYKVFAVLDKLAQN